MVERVFMFAITAILVASMWCFLGDTKKVYIAPPWEEMNDTQYELYLEYAETNPSAIPEPWEAGYPPTEPVDVVLTPDQERVIASLTIVQDVPWWLWRTESGSITYGQYNHRINYLQNILLVAAIFSFALNLIVRFALKGASMWIIFYCLVVPSFNLLYLVLPAMDEAFSLFTITTLACVRLTWWSHPKTDPDYRTIQNRYER